MNATIDRIEEGKAVLIFADGQKLVLDLAKLDSEAKEGDVIQFFTKTNNSQKEHQSQLAKDVLNEILNNE